MLISSPHTRNPQPVNFVMRQVVLATIPGALVLSYFFGIGIILNLLTCTLVAIVSESVILKLRQRDWRQGLQDYSAVVTAILLGLALPPLAPWWIATLGTLFAIVFAKQLYGGLGYNPFNPAMAGYVLLLISFPLSMTTWLPPQSLMQHPLPLSDAIYLFFTGLDSHGNGLNYYLSNVDGFAMATPLDELKTGLGMGYRLPEIVKAPIFNGLANVGWQWVNLAFLLGGIYLLVRRVIQWHIPVAMIASMTLVAAVLYGFDSDQNIPPVVHLLSGATMLGAFFIATDPVSAATTVKGRLIFGAGIGLIVVIIRNYGGYPDAVAFAVLLLNMTAPLIDHYTRPAVYGTGEQA
ncbi:MAG: electron transport complex subunit RsxD [Gammaproteobacteria bacterium]|nr:electron transport complex subunit RsxD [Gammaproteobacteria bacterium]NVK88791.1 electron transport complex subunit RsxD [Gammaproteobacteria bacterium]